MRKCKFKRIMKNMDNRFCGSMSVKGRWHCWAQDTDESAAGLGTLPIGIVEDYSGQVYKVRCELIRFTDEAKTEEVTHE